MTDLLGPGAYGAARSVTTRPAISPANGPSDPDTWVKDCTTPLLADGTEHRAAHMNAILAQLRNLIRRGGVADTNLDDALLARAVRSQSLNYVFTVGGTANAITLTPDPSFASLANLIGVPLWFTPTAPNTGNVTVVVSGLPAQALRMMPAEELAPGMLQPIPTQIMFDGGRFLMRPTVPMIRGLTGFGMLMANRQRFTTPGAFSYTVPAGVYRLFSRQVGGGGGGCGSSGATSNITPGGGGGAYAEKVHDVVPGQVVTGFIGVFGSGGASGLVPGTAGTSTTFNGVTTQGGGGGQSSGPWTTQVANFSGADFGLTGYSQDLGALTGTSSTLGGRGGPSPYGDGGLGGVQLSAGGTARGFGAGGGGASSGSGATGTGGDGTSGLVEIFW